MPEETKDELVKSLSFNLSQESRHRFDGALRQSYKDVAESLEMRKDGLPWTARTNDASETVDLNYSMTDVGSRREASASIPSRLISDAQTVDSEQFVNSVS